MTTTKVQNVTITASGSKGSATLAYNIATSMQDGVIELKWAGGSLKFSTVADYQQFLTELVKPATDIVNSPSGSGVGFVAMTIGTAGSDAVHN